jgi:signal transduction histidine kinase
VHKKQLFVCALFNIVLAAEASAPENPGVTVQKIVKQWAAVERLFITGLPEEPEPAALWQGPQPRTLLVLVDGFYNSVEEFLGSDMYRIYRYSPFLQKSPPVRIFDPVPPNDLTEILSVPALTASFRDALAAGNREGALRLALDIDDALLTWQDLDRELEHFGTIAYLRLFLILISFMVIMALAVLVLFRALTQSENQVKEGDIFSRRLVLAQETERSRIARELHDSVAQDLRYLALRIGKMRRTPDRAEWDVIYTEVAKTQEELIVRVRNICEDLIPPDFRFRKLADSLRQLCYDYGRRTGIDCRMHMEENISFDAIDKEMQLQVYRIVQEALTNAEQHGKAREVIVMIGKTGGDMFISVSDDGHGFALPWDGHRAAGHMGIRSMRERAAILGGTVTIESDIGEGTTVILRIPGNLPVLGDPPVPGNTAER